MPDLGPLKKMMNYMVWLLTQIALALKVDLSTYPGGPPPTLQ